MLVGSGEVKRKGGSFLIVVAKMQPNPNPFSAFCRHKVPAILVQKCGNIPPALSYSRVCCDDNVGSVNSRNCLSIDFCLRF